jgi:hypothetical protein
VMSWTRPRSPRACMASHRTSAHVPSGSPPP